MVNYNVDPKLINNDATPEALALMDYLCSIYGDKVLTGQQIGVVTQPEVEVIAALTGRYPAVYGFDMMNYSPSRVERGSSCNDVEEAIAWWNNGGIVTFCWHWNAPIGLVDIPPERSWDRGFYTEATTFNIAEAMKDEENELYQLMIRDIDAIAEQLKRLQLERVPVLWRPLHEASGGWFWWGAQGAEPFLKLWRLMYHRLTNVHQLNHLIWVWNGQHKDWYPGDEYVDIIGEDIYAPRHDYSSQRERFEQAVQYTMTPKLIALSENGVIPAIDEMQRDNAMWLWQCTWYGEFVCKRVTAHDIVSNNVPDGHEAAAQDDSEAAEREVMQPSPYIKHGDHYYTYCGDYTEKQAIIDFYNDPRSLTRDQLPNLKCGEKENSHDISNHTSKKAAEALE